MKRLSDKHRDWIYCIGFGIVTLVILWVTLLNRQPEMTRHIQPPFWSYHAIAAGNWKLLLESIGNVLLFVPVGFSLAVIWRRTCWQIVRVAFLSSMLIEVIQLVMKLGYFEVEDLLHNTCGAVLGSWLSHISGRKPFRQPFRRSMAIFVATVLAGLGVFGAYTGLNHVRMRIYAAMGDKEDCPNLLILNGEAGTVGDTQVSIRYLRNGTIRICGTSDVRAWKLIAQLELPPGNYHFSGLTGVEANTVALELEYYNPESEKFIRLTRDIGPVESDSFTLTEPTYIRAYVGVYPGCDCDVTARAVLYREGE